MLPSRDPDAVIPWSVLGRLAPDGIAVIDSDGLFVQLNSAALGLCGRDPVDVVGMPSPFEVKENAPSDALQLWDDGDAEELCMWAVTAGVRRHFAYRTRSIDGSDGLSAVSFRDVTAEHQRRRRISAIARTSATLATEGSLPVLLDALAREVLQADALAAVQILTTDDTDEGLKIMGSAGFRQWPDFFERLLQCRERGATLQMMDAIDAREPVVVADRWRQIAADPAWLPLQDYLGELEWGSFVSVPLLVRGKASGALNAFFVTGEQVGTQTLQFLSAMAEQAAIAVDYASLMRAEREVARREERQRIARDLHDSIVQQAFSVSMQAKSLGVLSERAATVPASAVKKIADEIGDLSRTVLADLRAMVHQLRPVASTQLGLEEAVRALVSSTAHRTGLQFEIDFLHRFDGVEADLAEDLYRIVAEALHNVVKHAQASFVHIRFGCDEHRSTLVVRVRDNGIGTRSETHGTDSHGYGLIGMRERAQRWGGGLTVTLESTGAVVEAVIPIPDGGPLLELPQPDGIAEPRPRRPDARGAR